MHELCASFQSELPSLLQAQPPLGVSPTLYRNWCLGRSIAGYLEAWPDQLALLEQLNQALLGTPVQGQAALLVRLYTWYPSSEDLNPRLSWAHFQALLGLYDLQVRDFYRRCALAGHWTAGQLRRQIQTHWHLRRSGAWPPDIVEPPHAPPAWLPDPLILEFAPQHPEADEAALEAAIVDHLGVFLLELGQGLSFVARQLRLTTFSGLQMVIDLVFYHHRSRHFVLFELKNAPLSAAAVGQLQSYLQAFDDCWKDPQDAPSLGIILCTYVDPALKRYSALYQSQHLFAVQLSA
jgi:predicted nuclease of restriction endonuclease-like (RecB) superfamily